VVQAIGKASETLGTFQEAMDRAQGLLDHIIVDIRDGFDTTLSVGDQTINNRVSTYRWIPERIEAGWTVRCEFEIETTVRVP